MSDWKAPLRKWALLALAGLALGLRSAPWLRGAMLLAPQIKDPRELAIYQDAKPIVDWPLAALKKSFPELKKLEAAESGDALGPKILEKVGRNVQAYFADFPNTSSRETITEEQLRDDGSVRDQIIQKFNYLALARPDLTRISLQEYRTDRKGKLLSPAGLESGFTVTIGFASLPVHFHPQNQPDSSFRFLGQEQVDRQQTYVFAFAQRPEKARVQGEVVIGGRQATVLFQGLAWIDARTYQILRLRTDLLAPRQDLGLEREGTETEFGPVQFRGRPQPVWLPRTVVVTMAWEDRHFRNTHRYSDYQLFSVGTEEKRQPPKP